MLASQLLNDSVAIAGYLVLTGIPNSVRPARVLRIEGAVYVAVGWRDRDLLLLVLAQLEQIYLGERVLYRSY